MIFIDLDGVCADFDEAILRTYGVNLKGTSKYVGSAQEVPVSIDFSELGHDFYSNLPVIEGTLEAISRMPAKYMFLTGTCTNPGCYSGKFQWLSKLFGDNTIARDKLILCGSESKKLLAGRGRILIDDRIRNIVEWEEAGGIGILHTDWKSTLEVL